MFSVIWPGDIRVSQGYGLSTLGFEPLWNGRHFHCGLDIAMGIGTPLKAARAGRVGAVGEGYLGIEVGAEVDWYIHIDRALVGLGQHVAQGQLVAYSGNKSAGGTTTGAHLHFEVQRSALALHGRGGSASVNNAGVPGNLNYPATSVNPADALAGKGGAPIAVSSQEEAMLYTGPFHAKIATLTVFAAGPCLMDPGGSALVVGSLAKGATVEVDGYVYSSLPVASTDLSGAAGTQAGNDSVFWRRKDHTGWVADAILNTSRLPGAPGAAIPAGEPFTNYFALAGGAQPATVDLDALATAIAAKLPAPITTDQVAAAVRDAIGKVKLSIP